MSAAIIPKGYRELRKGEVITRGTKVWGWNEGPFIATNSAGHKYNPASNGGNHWLMIRPAKRKAAKRAAQKESAK